MGRVPEVMYLIGLAIIALAVGHEYSPFHGWFVLGGGLIFCGIWDAIARTKPKVSAQDAED